MKSNQLTVALISILMVAVGGVRYLSNTTSAKYSLKTNKTNNHIVSSTNTGIQGLSEAEITGLLQMREEEKLARDVYLALYDKRGLQIFSNISTSEQTHTDAIKILLEYYHIADPVNETSLPGVFHSSGLQLLYNNLVAQGNISLLDGLMVGATVEDLDIKDLNELMSQTTQENIITTYSNLARGSRNHIRSFVKQIIAQGGTYIPQYISQDEFDTIITSSQEKGNGKHGGNRK